MKKRVLSLVMTLLILTMVMGSVSVFSASIGEQLTSPESGWQRIDDSNEMLYFSDNNWYIGTNGGTAFWNSTYKYTAEINSEIKFNFIGSKLRIIEHAWPTRANPIQVTIDGDIVETYDGRGTGTQVMVLLYEKTGLDFKEHSVVIKNLVAADLYCDAIDIDESGQIKPYNDNILLPAIPLNLTTTAFQSQILLNWDSVQDVTSYNVKRSITQGGPYTTIADSITTTSYTDTSIENGTTYYYVVTAVNEGGESENSNEASVPPVTPPASNAMLKITMVEEIQKEYKISTTEVDSFITWYDNRLNGTGKGYYIFDIDEADDAYTSRKEYILFDKIIYFEVMEY